MSQLGIVGKIEPATPKISMVIDIQSYEYYIPNESLYVPMSMFRQIQISYVWQKKCVSHENHSSIPMFKQIPFTADKSHSYIPLIINPYPQLYPSHITVISLITFQDPKAASLGGYQLSITLSNHGLLLRVLH